MHRRWEKGNVRRGRGREKGQGMCERDNMCPVTCKMQCATLAPPPQGSCHPPAHVPDPYHYLTAVP